MSRLVVKMKSGTILYASIINSFLWVTSLILRNSNDKRLDFKYISVKDFF